MKNKKILNNIVYNEVLADYKLALVSRNISLLGRKEVLTGKAKFGIFGDGKEVVQIALAKSFEKGDWRSGYYRDQTLMMALGNLSPDSFFAQLYGDTDVKANPDTGGRLMNNHFATANIDEKGAWLNLADRKNSSADISPTAGQMPRLLGLAQASKIFRSLPELHSLTQFSNKGNEVAFGTIGDSSTSEGHFFETLNAAGVLQVPLAMVVYDDGYGISVAKKYQTTKESISELLSGFQKTAEKAGFEILTAKGWDYAELVETFRKGVAICRKEHRPVLFHITELTQPQGHSTSGSHERYKSKARLEWEKAFDSNKKMREWILDSGIATAQALQVIENEAESEAKESRSRAWKHFIDPIKQERDKLVDLIDSQKSCTCQVTGIDKIQTIKINLSKIIHPTRRDNFSATKKILRYICSNCPQRIDLKEVLQDWLKYNYKQNEKRFSSKLYVENKNEMQAIKPTYVVKPKRVNGREILRDNFDNLFQKYPTLLTFGEDTGKIGGVNQSMENMQAKYGEIRVSDTGIRETTIVGQAIGLALRGLRPIAEIQYFDYLLYALQTLSDDLATVHYRTAGQQIAPAIIRTRGHRLEGVWHSGSPLSMVINSIRGIYVCVPRNMTKAAGFYNTLLQGQNPAVVIEPLNAYRLKEPKPDNFGEFTTALGEPEVMTLGSDVTVVTYGSCVRIAEDAILQLATHKISVELIDVQTLIPFDLKQTIKESVKKTNRVLFFDEDVPGGATAYMMQQVLETQKAFYYLDTAPRTLSAKDHRPAYSTDGDYFSNPNAEDVFEAVYDIMHESNPTKYPTLYNLSDD